MPLTPDDVRNKEFRYSFRGYNEEEVDAFLDEVEAEIGRLLSENNDLRQRPAAAAAAAATTPAAAPAAAPMSETEEMLRRTLLIAQRTADETVAEAKAEAERMLGEARAKSQQMVAQAQQQADAQIGDLENRRRSLEQHIESLRGFEREYRTRLKAYLEAQLRDLDSRSASGSTTAPPAAAGAPGAQPPRAAAQPPRPAAQQPPTARPAGDSGTRSEGSGVTAPVQQGESSPGGFVRRPDAGPGAEPPRVAP